MKTMEIERETFTAADVVLLIIKNDGELVDDLEYPAEFLNAYAMLQAFNIIKSENGKFVSASNFEVACKIGVQKFVERELTRSEKTAKNQRTRVRSLGFAALTTAAVAAAGYFYRKNRKENS